MTAGSDELKLSVRVKTWPRFAMWGNESGKMQDDLTEEIKVGARQRRAGAGHIYIRLGEEGAALL